MLYGIIIGTLMMVSFFIGLKIGLKIRDNQPIELNPVKTIGNVIKDTQQYIEETTEQEKIREKQKEQEEGIQNILNY
jgi:hypothetical protein